MQCNVRRPDSTKKLPKSSRKPVPQYAHYWMTAHKCLVFTAMLAWRTGRDELHKAVTFSNDPAQHPFNLWKQTEKSILLPQHLTQVTAPPPTRYSNSCNPAHWSECAKLLSLCTVIWECTSGSVKKKRGYNSNRDYCSCLQSSDCSKALMPLFPKKLTRGCFIFLCRWVDETENASQWHWRKAHQLHLNCFHSWG